jgi:SAM-dependent methyltransferase
MDPALAREYEAYEERHWWSSARRDILHSMLNEYVPGAKEGKGRWLDIGCGTGVILRAYPGFAEKIGVESDPATVDRARQKGVDARLISTPWDLSPLGQFDCITLFDVLEHIEHEQPAIAAVRSALKDNGTLLLTVPAIKSLWSDHDLLAHHYRRYRRPDLLRLFPDDQWQVLKLSYFSTLLFPLIFAIRQFKNLSRRLRPRPPQHDLKFGPPMIDGTLERLFRLEKHWLKRANFPIGSSLLLILRKNP